MRAEPQQTDSWFENDAILELEVRNAIDRRDPAPGIPGYEGLREIGQGGQGVVYVATQVGTRRKVAVKVLRERLTAAPEARRRFEREIDLAAGLRHPHIVAVFDGGTTPDGRPYLVMEFIEGESIDACPVAHALQGKWSRPHLEAVLRMFATVCDGIQHAHQRGVIHRDVKPSNIRVDSDGVARVLDFGLAKVVGPTSPSSVTATEAGAGRFVGSLPWASPEQAAGRTDAIDVRSDVYALGVTLYQLVTGHFPYDVSGDLNAALHNIVATLPTPPRRYVKNLDSDLVTIMLRALAKDPDRRFQSARDLALDLRAYLAHEPIAARRDSLWYLIRVTARRRKRTVIIAAGLLLALAASAVVSFILWRSAERSRQEAVASAEGEIKARKEAVEGRETSKGALELLLDSLYAVDPDADGKDARVVDALDRTAAQVESRFGDKIEVRAWLHTRLGSLFDRLGRPDRASEEAAKAAELWRAFAGGDDPRALEARCEAAFLRHKAGHSAEAVPDLEEVLTTQRRVLGADSPAALATANYLARCFLSTGRFKDAEKLEVEALARSRARNGPDSPDTLDILEGLAHARRLLGDLESAEVLQREAYDRRVATVGVDQLATLNALSNLIVVLTEHGKLREAEPLQKAQYERTLAKLGPDHTTTLTAANTYAKILQDLGRLDEAAPLMQTTYDTRERILGPDHRDTLISLANLAAVRGLQKDLVACETLDRKVLAARLRTLGPRHLETLVSHNNLATVLREQGRLEEALKSYEDAAQGADGTLGQDHWITALFRANQGATLTQLGRHAEAEPLLIDAQKTIEAKLGADHAHAKTVRRYLTALREATSRPTPRPGE